MQLLPTHSYGTQALVDMCTKGRLIPSSIKPCNFTVRGINTGGMQPSWMGDVEEILPLRGGGVVRCLLKGAVCIEQSPHDIISACLLENDGVCDWRGVLPDGNEVYLENHRFLLMPRCTTGQTTHNFDTDGNGVMFVGDRSGLDMIGRKTKMVRAHDGHMVNVAVQTLPRKKHWSKSVFASELGKRDLVGAKKWLAGLKSDFDYTVANGADEFHEVGASKYLGMAPYIQQLIDELTTETSITQSSALSDVK